MGKKVPSLRKITLKQIQQKIFSPSFFDYFSICVMMAVFLIYYYSLNFRLLRYTNTEQILSINISSLVSILAIGFTLSLMIVQYATEKYSIKLINYYIKDKLFWLLFFQYLFSIIFNLITLSFFSMDFNLVDISLILTMYCFILIIPQIMNIANSIQPERLASYLLEDCKKRIIHENLLGNFRSVNSPIRQLYEFSKSMIINEEYSTFNKTIDEINLLILQKEDKDLNSDLIDNFNNYYYSLFDYSITHNKPVFCKLILSNYFEVYKHILQNKYDFNKARLFYRLLDELMRITFENNINSLIDDYIRNIGKVCIIQIDNYLPHQDEIFLFRDNLLEKKENDMDDSMKYHDFDSNLRLLYDIGDYCVKNKLFQHIGNIIYQSYEIFSEMFKKDRGERMTYVMMSTHFYSLSDLCYKCIDNGYEDFFNNILISSVNDYKKYHFWLYEITKFITNISLYQSERDKCTINSYWEIGYLGRVIAPNEIEVLKYLVDILEKIALLEIKRMQNEQITLLNSQHKMNISEIVKTIESIRDWNNQQDLSYKKYVNHIIYEIKDRYEHHSSNYIV